MLPGFQFRISDLYRQPDTEELVKDEVYQGFVMVNYQAEKERADSEKERADSEKERADSEKERADRIQSQLALEQQEKEEAVRRAEEERKEKEEAVRRAEEERKEKERLIALLKQMGISPD